MSASSTSCFFSQVSKKWRSRCGEIGCGSPAAVAYRRRAWSHQIHPLLDCPTVSKLGWSLAV
jgi:hypothetical protein